MNISQHKYLVINSFDRSYGTPSDFSVSLPYSLKFNSVELIECFIPNTFWNITDYNNGIVIDNILYHIPNGCYNLNELIQVIINTIAPFTNISYDDSQGKITITSSSSITLSFPSSGSINKVLGYPDDYSITGTSFVSSFGPSISYYQIYIEILELSSNFMTTNNHYKYPTFIVTNNVNKGYIATYTQHSQYDQMVNIRDNTQNMYNLSIKLKDQFGNVLIGSSEWSFTIKFF